MNIPRIDTKNLLGLLDKAVGLGKETIGTLTSRKELAKAGRVQQQKGTERLKAIQAQLEADAHEAQATALEETQKRAQSIKEKVNS